MRHAWSAVALLAFAGCFGAAPPPAVPPPHVETGLHFPWVASGCNGRGDYVATDYGWTKAQLPDGYVAEQFFPAQRGVFSLITLHCDAVQTDNATPPRADQVTFVTVQLKGGSFASQGFYLLRVFASDPAGPLAMLFAQAGVDVVEATADIASWDGAMTLKAGEESVQIDPIGPRPDAGDSHSDPSDWHLFHETHDGTLQWDLAVGSFLGTESYLARIAQLSGGSLAGSCPNGPCEANTDDYREFGIEADFVFAPAHGEA